MRSLDEILDGMDPELFQGDPADLAFNMNPDDDPDMARYMQENYSNPDIISQEAIPNNLARALLNPKEYSENCRYQMITMRDSTLIIRIDDSVPEDSEQHIKEFTLDTDDEVQSYDAMQKAVLNPKPYIGEQPKSNPRDLYSYKKSYWWVPIVCILASLLIIGLLVMSYLFKLR